MTDIEKAVKHITEAQVSSKQKNIARSHIQFYPSTVPYIVNSCAESGELNEYLNSLTSPPHPVANALRYLSVIFNKCDLFPQQPLVQVPEEVVAFCADEDEETPPTPQLEQRLRAFAEQTMSSIIAHIQDTHTVKKPELNPPPPKPKPPAKKKPAKKTIQPKTVQNVSDDEDDGSTYAADVSDFSEFFESVESKDDPRAKLLRIKQDSGLKNENVFLVESKWPTQRLVLQGKYPLRLIMITQKHARWMLGFARQHNITLVPPGTTLEAALADMSVQDKGKEKEKENESSSSSGSLANNRGKPLKVFLVSEEVMEEILGYVLHRGCMALAERMPLPTVPELLAEITRGKENEPILVVVAEHVSNPDNVGAMFRSALALGASAVFLDTTSSDPLYRKCIRSSMGAVTKLPYAWISNFGSDMKLLRSMGFAVFALALTSESTPLSKVKYPPNRHVAVMVGHEGDGLSKQAIAEADQSVKIEMVAHSVDSLNVSACTSVALYTIAQTIQLLQ
eukprot:Phypoly_transcript_06162.p1 GENE.Phypoly_transcript_06162~~Phypoly_transcript_06162.p1  ORF type:complete len:538 (+),score=100.36 Phypoly_transcript_06162:93-1616(+)